MSLGTFSAEPFELLLELERRAHAAIARREGGDGEAPEWVGVAFRLGAESLVAARSDVREVLPVPESMARVPGAKSWLRGIANVRGQLLTVVDLKAFLGGGISMPDRHSRVLALASREVPTGLMVDEVLGFRRFTDNDYRHEAPATVIRCEAYLEGGYRRGSEVWPRFSLAKLLQDELFLKASEVAAGQ